MNEQATPVGAAAIKGEEHWTTKDGGVKLFLWEKCANEPAQSVGTILFVHGSSMASQPTFDLQVPGRPDSSVMDHFARRFFDCWCLDCEGYGRSTKDRDNNAPIAQGADDCFAAATYIQKLRGKRPLLVYGISSGALRAALFAQRHPELVGRLALDAMVWTGEGSPTLAERKKKLAEFQAKNRRPIDKAFIHSIFDRDHPGTAEERVIDTFADAVIALDELCADRHLCRHVRAPAGGRSGTDHGADLDHARPMGRHRELRRSFGVLRKAAQPGQAFCGDARHLARELPAKELRAGPSHLVELLHAARAGLSGLNPQLARLYAKRASGRNGRRRGERPPLHGSRS